MLCLLSALQFHEIGTQLPHGVVTLRSDTNQLSYPQCASRACGGAYSEGIQTVTDHASIRVYSAAKTVSCFKFRVRLALDVALGAERRWRGRKVTMAELEPLRQDQPGQCMQPYLEAVTQ